MDKQSDVPDWIETVKQRGYGDIFHILLDTIEPIAPIVAQGLWVFQPLAGLWNGTQGVQSLAQLLETPEGIAELRQRLVEDDTQE